MNREEAREILRAEDASPGVVTYHSGGTVQLDGHFTAREVEAVLTLMRPPGQPSGVFPSYTKGTSPEARIAMCIEHEYLLGGNAIAAAHAILRGIRLGYITTDPTSACHKCDGTGVIRHRDFEGTPISDENCDCRAADQQSSGMITFDPKPVELFEEVVRRTVKP